MESLIRDGFYLSFKKLKYLINIKVTELNLIKSEVTDIFVLLRNS